VYEELGRQPTRAEFDDLAKYSSNSLVNRFGSWKQAKEQAGIDQECIAPGARISRDELIADLKSVGEKIGGVPTQEALTEHGEHSKGPIIREFGSWENGLRAAGFNPENRDPPNKIDSEQLLEDILELKQELGKVPNTTEMDQYGKHDPSTYSDRFGSYKRAVERAGLDASNLKEYGVGRRELLSELFRLADDLGRVPKMSDMRSKGRYSCPLYIDRFGSWNHAVRCAGFEPNTPITEGRPRRTNVGKDELKDDLRRVQEQIGVPPTRQEYDQIGVFNPNSLQYHYGSWSECLEAAGIDPDKRPDNKISDEELLSDLRAGAEALGRNPIKQEIDAFGEYSASTYVRRFGSFEEALASAGLLDSQKNGADEVVD
jgi:hypothetical protein